MRAQRTVVVIVAMIGMLHCLASQASAGGGGVPGCQVDHPAGPPVRITILTKDFSVSDTSVNITNLTVTAQFAGQTTLPLTVSGSVQALNTLEAACNAFNELGLSSQILSALGLPGTTLTFTTCSFFGASDPSCDSKPGIHAPLGFGANIITGYGGR